MFSQIDRSLHALYRCCAYLAAAFIVLIGILVLVNITSRLLGVFVPGMTEGAGYSMAAAGALGLAYTFGEHGHIRVTMLIGKLRGRARYGSEMLALAVAAMFASYLGFYLLRMIYVSYQFEDRS
ncbi:MAG: TRAP transporter small permease subunit, partial [Hyphomicrobiales bacterium]|nr:TRAP transporter small permease subunit [Hyphomicrobiales bacterium]